MNVEIQGSNKIRGIALYIIYSTNIGVKKRDYHEIDPIVRVQPPNVMRTVSGVVQQSQGATSQAHW